MENPSYKYVVKPLLDEDSGDPTELLIQYPHFDPHKVPCDVDEYTYFKIACLYSHYDVVLGLVQCGASLLHIFDTGCTPIFLVTASMPLLISENGDNDSIDFIKPTKYDVMKLSTWILNQNGADASLILGNEYSSPLQLARHFNDHQELIQLLEHSEIVYNIKKVIRSIGEWRPWNNAKYPSTYRKAMITLLLLSKSK